MQQNKYYLLQLVYVEGQSFYKAVYNSPTITGVATKKIQLQAVEQENKNLSDYMIVKELEYGIGVKKDER